MLFSSLLKDAANYLSLFAFVGVPFPFRLLLPIHADAAVGVVRGIVALASPTAKL